jgi:hypothetical protein
MNIPQIENGNFMTYPKQLMDKLSCAQGLMGLLAKQVKRNRGCLSDSQNMRVFEEIHRLLKAAPTCARQHYELRPDPITMERMIASIGYGRAATPEERVSPTRNAPTGAT